MANAKIKNNDISTQIFLELSLEFEKMVKRSVYMLNFGNIYLRPPAPITYFKIIFLLKEGIFTS